MPELPEVETVRRGLVALLDGRSVVSAQVLHPRPVRRHPAGPDDFATTLIGRRLRAPRRRGKFLWFPFADGDAMVAHLGMSGQFRDDHPEAPLPPNARVLIDLDNGRQLRFVDQRMFGGLWLSPGGADLPDEVRRIALDPFDSAFDAVTVARSMSHRKAGIKRLLLDQCVVSGSATSTPTRRCGTAPLQHPSSSSVGTPAGEPAAACPVRDGRVPGTGRHLLRQPLRGCEWPVRLP